MDQPIRCFTCSSILHPLMYKQYSDAIDRGMNSVDALHQVQDLNALCFACNRMILSHIPLAEEQFYMAPKPRPASFNASLTDFMKLHKLKPQETSSTSK